MHRLKSANFAVAAVCLCLSLTIPAGVSPALAERAIVSDFRNQRQKLIAQENEAQKPMPKLCRNLQPQFTLAGHLSPVTAMAISADSKTLVSGDRNGVINVWNLETGKLLHELAAYPGNVAAVAITPDGKYLVSLVRDREDSTLSVWSLETGQLIRRFDPVAGEFETFALSPDGKSIVSVFKMQRTGAPFDEKPLLEIKVQNLQTGEAIQTVSKPGTDAKNPEGVIVTILDGQELSALIRVNEVLEQYSSKVNVEFLNRPTGVSIPPPTATTHLERRRNYNEISTQTRSKKIAATATIEYAISFIGLRNAEINQAPCTVPRLGAVQTILLAPNGQQLIVAGQKIDVLSLNPIPVTLDRAAQQPKIQHLNHFGFDKLKRKQYFSASRHFWQVFKLNRQLADEQGQIDALYNIAQANYATCQIGIGRCPNDEYYRGLYALILPYFQEKGDHDRAAISLQRNKPNSHARDSENPNNEEKRYWAALRKYRSLGNREAEAYTLVKIALIKPYRNQSEQEALLKPALKLYRTVGDRKGELEVLHALGLSYSGVLRDKDNKPLGWRTTEAITYLQAAIVLSREMGDRFLESSILLDLGDSYRWGKQYSQALASYQSSLYIRRSLGDETGEDILLYRIAQTLRSLGQYQLALEAYKKTLAVCRLKDSDCLEMDREYQLPSISRSIFQEIGEFYFALKQYPEALNYFLQETGGSEPWVNDKNLGMAYEKLGNIDLALKYFNKSIRVGPRGCGDGSVADATIVEAIRQDNSMTNDGGECQGYRETWPSSLRIATFHAAEIYRRRGQYDQAIEMYKTRLASSWLKATILNNLGTLYKAQGDYEKALKTYQEALLIRQNGILPRYGLEKDLREKDVYGEAVSLNNIGEIYRRQGQYPKSLETYQQSLKIFRNLINSLTADQAKIIPFQDVDTIRQGEASVLHNFGSVYYDLGQYDKAIDYYNQALSISKTLDDKVAEGRSLNNIGLVYEAQKQYAQALAVYQQALTARRDADDRPGIAATLNNIGLLQVKLNQPNQGLEPLQQALDIYQQLEDKASIANSLDSLGTLHTALGQTDIAWSNYQSALQLAKSINLPPLERTIFTNMSNLLTKTKQPELAIAFYKQSVNLTETMRDELRSLPREQQESYTQTVIGTYRNLADLLIQQGRLPEAHAVLELLKLRELREFTRDAGIDSPGISIAAIEQTALNQILNQFTTLGKFSEDIAKCERTKCANFKQLETQRDSLYTAVNRELNQQRAILAKHFSTEAGTLTPGKLNDEARRVVNAQPGTALIYPLILKDKIQFLLALKTGDGGVTFRPFETKVTADQLFKTIKTFREQLGETTIAGTPKTNLATVQATSQQLYEWLIKPLEPELSNSTIKHLVFAPDSTTRYIPLAALYDGKQYLIQRFSISTITAATETDTEATTPKPTGNQSLLLAMGASTFQTLNPLVNVPAELDAITKTSQASDRQGIYPGSKFLNTSFDYTALQDSLKKGTYRILHLATHGAFKPGRPEDSYLVPGRGKNLTTELIDQLGNYGLGKLHLVVLSACETAVGDRASDGMEIPGISYFFLKNDVKSVMASLWNVNDASTALIMQQFYKHLANGKTKAEALKAVQQDFINGKLTANDAPRRSDVVVTVDPKVRAIGGSPANFSHPYYWAPFILIGNSL